MNYLEHFGILSKYQNGYRKKKDSVQAATSFFKQIEANWKKLNHVGIRGLSYKLLTNCLTNRFQYLKIEGECLAMKLIKTWRPTGIYIILVYINELGVHEDWQSEIIKYADDTVMIEKLNTQSKDKVLFQSWASLNLLNCNYTKTKSVVFEKT